MAIGAITRIDVKSNFINWNFGIPTHEADAIDEKLSIAEPSGLCTPHALRISANTYEITTPIRIGIILKSPLPHILNIIITASATNASNQLVDALVIAEPASERPIQIMIGPVTTGGRNFITLLTPTSLIISASTK